MNIPGEMQKISVGIYKFSPKRTLKARAHPAIVFVDRLCVGNSEKLHGMGNVVGKSLDEEVVMVEDQGVGDNQQVSGEVFVNSLEEEVVVFGFEEYLTPVVAAVVEVVIVAGNQGNVVLVHFRLTSEVGGKNFLGMVCF